MRKNVLLAAVILLSAAWAFAQAYPSQSNPSDQNNPSAQTQSQSTESQSSAAAGGMTTVEGCLSGSNGNYTLTAKDGTTYQLTGKTSKLDKHVGHEIQVKGTTSSSASSTSGTGSQTGAASSPSANTSSQSLDVKSFKHISGTCSAGGSK